MPYYPTYKQSGEPCTQCGDAPTISPYGGPVLWTNRDALGGPAAQPMIAPAPTPCPPECPTSPPCCGSGDGNGGTPPGGDPFTRYALG